MPVCVTLDQATGTNSYPIRRMVKDHGSEVSEAWAVLILTEADAMVGGKNPPNVIAMWARMLMGQWGHRSCESVVMAIRDGMTSGKVYGSLNYPQISEWMQAHEAKILGHVESDAARHKFTGDNLGAGYLDRTEHDAGWKDRMIDQLRRKLDNK